MRYAPILALCLVWSLHGAQAQIGGFVSAESAVNSRAATDGQDDADRDPRIAAARGTVVATWIGTDSTPPLYADNVWVARSTDGGVTWEPSIALTSSTQDEPDHWNPTVVTNGDGVWILAWHYLHYRPPDPNVCQIMVSRSTDNAASWSTPTAIASYEGNCAVSPSDTNPTIATNTIGDVIVMWTSRDSLGGTIDSAEDVFLSRSSDDGATWSPPGLLGAWAATSQVQAAFPHLATDGRGTWIVVSQNNDGFNAKAVFSKSTDNGVTWSAQARLNPAAANGVDETLPTITTDGKGTWIVVMESDDDLGGTIGTDRDLLIMRSSDDGETWSPATALNTHASVDNAYDILVAPVATDRNGDWRLAWESRHDFGGTIGTDADIVVAHSTDDGVTWSDPAPINTAAATDSSSQGEGQIIFDGRRNWVATWDSYGSVGSDHDILTARLLPLEVVDPNPDLMVGADVSTATSILQRFWARKVVGYAADGATRVVLRIEVPGPGTATWRVFNQFDVQTTNVGVLAEPGDLPGTLTELTTDVRQPSPPDGPHYAFAVLHAPPDGEWIGNDIEPMEIEVEYCASGAPSCPPGGLVARREFQIHRPPVTLLHGIYGSAATFRWDDSWAPLHIPGLQEDPRFYTFTGNYEGIHDRHFSEIVDYWKSAIVDGSVRAMRFDRDIAVTRTFVFAHSMGAPITRLYIDGQAADGYLRNDNFNRGDIVGFSSISGVHLGSVLAEQLWQLQGSSAGSAAARLARKAGYCIDCGAIEDLRYDSPVIRNLPGTPDTPVHAIYADGATGIQYSALFSLLPYKLEYPLKLLQSFGYDLTTLMGQCNHDGVVYVATQTGALGDPDTTSRMAYVDDLLDPQYALHWSVCKEWQTNLRAVELMYDSIESPCVDCPEWELPGFPDNSTLPSSTFTQCIIPPPLPARAEGAGAGTGGLVVTSPAPGTLVQPGSSITVSADVIGGFPIQRLIVSNSAGEIEFADSGPPWSVPLAIPESAAGELTISAVALGGMSNELAVEAEDVRISVDLSGATLTAIAATPDPMILSAYTTSLPITVTGTYADGARRDLGGSALGTTYDSTRLDIAVVDAEGFVTAVGIGQTRVDVAHGGQAASVLVSVEGMRQALSMDATDLRWPAQPEPASYDIVQGDLAALLGSGGDFSTAVTACFADDLEQTSVGHGEDPDPGEVVFFLMRSNLSQVSSPTYETQPEWPGSGQTGSRDASIGASAWSCL